MTAAPYHVEKAAKKAAAEPQDGMGALASFPSALRDSPATTNPFTKEGRGALADARTTTLAGSWLRAAALHTKILPSRDSYRWPWTSGPGRGAAC